jgi:hypothetical protein
MKLERPMRRTTLRSRLRRGGGDTTRLRSDDPLMDAQRLSWASQIRTLIHRFAIALHRRWNGETWDIAFLRARLPERPLPLQAAIPDRICGCRRTPTCIR